MMKLWNSAVEAFLDTLRWWKFYAVLAVLPWVVLLILIAAIKSWQILFGMLMGH